RRPRQELLLLELRRDEQGLRRQRRWPARVHRQQLLLPDDGRRRSEMELMARRFGFSVLLVLAAACDGSGGGVYILPEAGVPTSTPDAAVPGLGVGQACSDTVACRTGLACTAGACQPCGCTASGAACFLNDDCAAGSFCGASRTCTT